MSIPLVVTKRYKGQRSQPTTQTNRDPNRDKTLARSNQPKTSEIYRRQDGVFGYELQFPLFGVRPVFQNLNHKLLQRRLSDALPCPSNKSSKVIQHFFSSSRRVTRRQVLRHLTSNGTGQCQNGSLNFLTPYREQPRSTRIVVVYPRPAFSATKWTKHAPISFDQHTQVSQGHTSYRNKEN